MRTAEITLEGVTYPLCFSLAVMDRFTQRYGSLEGSWKKIEELGQAGDLNAAYEEYFWQLEQLLEGGRRRVELDGGTAPALPDLHKDRNDRFTLGDMRYIQERIAVAIVQGSQREVGAAAPKNGVAAGGAAQSS